MSCLRNAKVMKILVYDFFFLRIFVKVYLSQTDNICLGARSQVLPSMFSFRFLFLTFHIQNWFISARNSVAFSIPWQWVPLLVQSLKSQPPAHTQNQQMYQGESSCRGQISHLCESLSLSGILVPLVLIVSVPLCRLQKDDFCILSGFSECSLQKHWFTTNYSISLGSGNNPFSFLNMLKSFPLKTHQTLH